MSLSTLELGAAVAAPQAPIWTEVHKFGGSCTADIERLGWVARRLIESGAHRVCAVVSAARGVTDGLVALWDATSAIEQAHLLTRIALRQRSLIDGLGDPLARQALSAALDADLDLIGQELARRVVDSRARILGLGEIWSARLLHALLIDRGQDAGLLDSARVLLNTSDEGSDLDYVASARRLRALGGASARVTVAPGFIASTAEGRASLLGRNGSDLSAVALARIGNAARVVVWKDVDGVLSADPDHIPQARWIPRISHVEAAWLARSGSRVLHGPAALSAAETELDLSVRALDAEGPGTEVGADSPEGAKAVALRAGLVRLRQRGAARQASRLRQSLDQTGVVPAALQFDANGDAELWVEQADAAAVEAALRRASLRGFEADAALPVDCERSDGLALVSLIGHGVARSPSLVGKCMQLAVDLGVELTGFQCSSDGAVVQILVAGTDAPALLRGLHASLFEGPRTEVAVLGCGTVGKALLRRWAGLPQGLRERLDLVWLANSRHALVEPPSEPLAAIDALAEAGPEQPSDLGSLSARMLAGRARTRVILDATASADVAARHAQWLGEGLHVITANKRAIGECGEGWARIDAVRRKGRTFYGDSACVGAGLPVLRELRRLREGGERIIEVAGVLSGSMGWIFRELDRDRRFSSVVSQAARLGFTEPDPREDLGLADVLRKLRIIARTAGWGGAHETVESWLPAHWYALPVAHLDAHWAELDEPLARRVETARKAGRVLRPIARASEAGLSVAIEAVELGSALADGQGSDNVVLVRTQRYDGTPLIIRGPGAGPEVTAGALLDDLLDLVRAEA